MSVTECKHGNNVVDEICGHCWVEVCAERDELREALKLCRAALWNDWTDRPVRGREYAVEAIDAALSKTEAGK